MAAENGQDNLDQILYDLLVQAEWQLEAEPVARVVDHFISIINACNVSMLNKDKLPTVPNESKAEQEFWKEKGPLHWKLWKLSQITLAYLLQTLRSSIRLTTSFGCPPTSYTKILCNHLPWHFTLSSDGKVLAILTDETIEIRSWKDSFNSVIAKYQVGPDPFPQWRKITWNKTGSLLAFATSFGEISVFDTSCSRLYTIKQHSPSMKLPTGFSNCFCSLFFTDAQISNDWENELVSVTYQGILHRYHLSHSDYKEAHVFSFSRRHPSGVAAVMYAAKHNLLVVAGFDGDEPTLDEADFSGQQAGITLWREVSASPHYSLVETDAKEVKRSKLKSSGSSLWKKNTVSLHGIYKCCLSPNEDTLLTLHQNGRVAFWRMPSIKLQNTWSFSEQPSSGKEVNTLLLNDRANVDGDSVDLRNFVNISWWSEKAAIYARGSGAIAVSSTKDLENLLGHSEELFEPWPCITDACDGQFLVLECEKKVKKTGENKAFLDADHFDQDDDLETSLTRISKICKQTMFFLTENESFKPTSKKIRFMQRAYRLIALQSTTPEELYARKINLEEYGEALELAQRFKLDTDLVYQRQWTKSPITVISIKDYLSKINNRFWVLNECVKRVPEDIDAMKHLLKYGLLGTHIKIIQDIETGDKIPFVHSECVEGDNDDTDENSKKEEELYDALKSLNFASLAEKQLHLCRYRWQILQYLDRLETYETILGGPFRAAERYKPDFFLQFRCCNVIDQAVEYARTSFSEPLEDLFTYHGSDVLPHWLAILSNFPETTPVSSYKRLLPTISKLETGELKLDEWKTLTHREPDWVELPLVKNHVVEQEYDEDQSEFIYEDDPRLRDFRSCDDPELLTKWFKLRAHEIDARTNLVDNALSLIEYGIQNNVQGLEEIRDSLKWLGILIYEVNVEPAINLSEFEELSDLAKLRLLMCKSTEDTFVKDYQRWGVRFLAFVGRKAAENQRKLLKKYLTDVAKSDLTFPLKIFEKSVPGSNEPLIADVARLMSLAIECIYICKRDDQLDLAFKIVECLPSREDSHLSTQIDALHEKVDRLEQYLRGSEIFKLYSIPKPVSFLVNSQGDIKCARDIFITLCRNASRKKPSLKPTEWNMFLRHILHLREEVYDCISTNELYQTFGRYLLCSGLEENLYLAKELLTATKQKAKEDHRSVSNQRTKKAMPRLTNASTLLPYEVSVELVLEAAKEYFNAGSNMADPSMELARKCLGLIEDSPPLLQFESDLISALAILNDFDVNILPLQVRLYEDKLDLIRLVVNSGSAAYKKTAKIHKLAKLLQLSGGEENDRLGKVTTILAETSLENEDFTFARDMCLSLVDLSYASAWKVCRNLCESEAFTDLEAKKKLVGFSLTFCRPDELEPLLLTRNLIETQMIYENLSKQEVYRSESDTEIEDSVADSTDGQAPSSLLNRTQKQLKSKTKAIISNVSDTKWWKSQVRWARNLDKPLTLSKAETTGNEREQCRMKYHPFYTPKSDVIMKDFEQCLQEMFDTDVNDQRLLVNTLLLRSQKLSEARAEGDISEPSAEVLIQLAESELYHESVMFLACILSLASVMDAEELFSNYHGDPFVLQLIAYALAIELESQNIDKVSGLSSQLYSKRPLTVIKSAVKAADNMSGGSNKKISKALRKYLLILSDFVQARMLEDLGKGVDVNRFMQDNEYKRETVLGLAMNLEDNLLSIAISLAEKYGIPSWEVVFAHVEFLLTDSGLKGKEIQERLTKLDVATAFSKNSQEVMERIRLCIYPYLNGTDLVMLLVMFNLVQQCCGDDAKVEGSVDAASHVRALKKIKAGAPGVNYKELISGDKSLEAVKAVLMESNVHLLAKLVPKLSVTHGNEGVTSGEIFAAYILKMFWEGDKKQEDNEAQWLHRFESCQKLLSKISPEDILTFAQDVTLSDRAVDAIPRHVRLNIIKRVLKYVRQQKAQEEKQIDQEGQKTALAFSAAKDQLEKSHNHLQSLEFDLLHNWMSSDDEKERNYARRLEIFGSDPVELASIATDLFLDLRKPEEISEAFKALSRQGKVKDFVAETFRRALSCITETLQSPQDIHRSNFISMIDIVKDHLENNGELLSQEDVLRVVRPICANVEVRTDLKMEVLQLLERSFELCSDDVFLLVYYQTDAILTATWARQINQEDVDSDEKRCNLFHNLISESDDSANLESLGKLLLAWPVLASIELNEENPAENPWIILFTRLIEKNSADKFLELLKLALHKVTFGLECYMDLHRKLVLAGFLMESLKMALISGNEICADSAFQVFHGADVDESFNDNEVFQLTIQTDSVGKVAKTSLFPLFVEYVLAHSKNEVAFNKVLNQLRSAGLEVEAGTLLMKQSNLSRGLSTISVAVSSFKNWFQR